MSNNAQYLHEAAQAEKKWSPKRYLEGLDQVPGVGGGQELTDLRKSTSVLLENQELENNRLMRESMTDTGDVARFSRISIPLVRRIFPQLIANKIVSVQPLLGPVGQVFYLRFRYSSNKGEMRGADLQGGYPMDDAASMQQLASGDVNLNVYYTSQFVENEATSVNPGGGSSHVSTFPPLEHTPILPGTVAGTLYSGSTAVQSFVVAADGTFNFTDIGSPTVKAVAAGSSLDYTTGELLVQWNGGGDPEDNHVVLSYEYNMECNSDLPEMNLAIENDSITAKTRKLKASWSPEASQDIRSQHNLDVENELTGVLAQEINLEIDREVLGDLLNNAGTRAVWDFNTALGDTIKEKYESLYVKLMELSAVVQRKTLRGGCNWVVCSPEVASIFETATAGFAPAPGDGFTSSLGVQYVGTVNKKFRVYKDPQFRRNQILTGYKGESYMDSGYFYCPYVPLTQTPLVMDPDSFCHKKGILTRYGKVMLRDGAKFFASMQISNFSL